MRFHFFSISVLVILTLPLITNAGTSVSQENPPKTIMVTLRDGFKKKCEFQYIASYKYLEKESLTASYLCFGPDGSMIVRYKFPSDPNSDPIVRVIQIDQDGVAGVVRIGSIGLESGEEIKADIQYMNIEKNSMLDKLSLLSASLSELDPAQVINKPKMGTEIPANFMSLLKKTMETSRKVIAALQKVNDELSIVYLRLENGSTIKCMRGGSSNSSSMSDKNPFDGRPCEFFVCDSITIQGKIYEPIFYQDFRYFNASVLTLSNKEGLGPLLKVNKLEVLANGKMENFYEPTVPQEDHCHVTVGHRQDPAAVPKELDSILPVLNQVFEPYIQGVRRANAKNCVSEELQRRLAQEEKYLRPIKEKLNAEDLALWIESVDGIVIEKVISKKMLPPTACNLEEDVWCTREVKDGLKVCSPQQTDFRLGSAQNPMSLNQARELFKKLKDIPDFPYAYLRNGCEHRTYLMNQFIRKEGFESERVVASNPLQLSPLQDKEELWFMHTAPSVFVKNKGNHNVRMVLDPSIALTPISLLDWAALIAPSGEGRPLVAPWLPYNYSLGPYYRTKIFFLPWNTLYWDSEDGELSPERIKKQNEMATQRIEDQKKMLKK